MQRHPPKYPPPNMERGRYPLTLKGHTWESTVENAALLASSSTLEHSNPWLVRKHPTKYFMHLVRERPYCYLLQHGFCLADASFQLFLDKPAGINPITVNLDVINADIPQLLGSTYWTVNISQKRHHMKTQKATKFISKIGSSP